MLYSVIFCQLQENPTLETTLTVSTKIKNKYTGTLRAMCNGQRWTKGASKDSGAGITTAFFGSVLLFLEFQIYGELKK